MVFIIFFNLISILCTLFFCIKAEICCLAVHPNYRRSGRGETILAYLERRALLMGINELFLLSTRTMQWFEERGFIQVELLLILHILISKVNCPYSFKIDQSDPSALPITRKYDSTRGSKVYIKVKAS